MFGTRKNKPRSKTNFDKGENHIPIRTKGELKKLDIIKKKLEAKRANENQHKKDVKGASKTIYRRGRIIVSAPVKGEHRATRNYKKGTNADDVPIWKRRRFLKG